MIKIEDWHRSGRGERRFRLIFSEPGTGWKGFSVWAESEPEIHEALNHYYRSGPRPNAHTLNEIEHCPLCRKSREEEAKRPKLRLVHA